MSPCRLILGSYMYEITVDLGDGAPVSDRCADRNAAAATAFARRNPAAANVAAVNMLNETDHFHFAR